MAALQRRSPEPLYAQLEETLLDRLRRDYKPGSLLPTQRELAAEFSTSLITVKRALDELARKGYLRSTRGRGTVVVRPPIEDDRRGLTSWTDSMTGLGRLPRTVGSRLETRVPPPDVARALGLKARERTVILERFRSLDGEPFCVMRNELPQALVPSLAEEGLHEESLYGWLNRRHGLNPLRADEEVSARRPAGKERRFLGRETKMVLVIKRHTWLTDGRPLEIAEMAAPADRYRYRVEIRKTP